MTMAAPPPTDPLSGNGALRLIMQLLPRLVGAERCSIFLHDRQTGVVWSKCGTGIVEREIEVPLETSMVGRCIDGNQILVAEGLDAARGVHKHTDAATQFITRNLICVPIPGPGDGPPIGAIELLNKAGDGFSEEDQALLVEVARYLGARFASPSPTDPLAARLERLERRAALALWLAFGAVALSLGLAGVLAAG